jgi:hypothetical protein
VLIYADRPKSRLGPAPQLELDLGHLSDPLTHPIVTKVLNASTRGEIDAAFASLAHDRGDDVYANDVLFVSGDALFQSRSQQLVGLTARERIPAAYPDRATVAAAKLLTLEHAAGPSHNTVAPPGAVHISLRMASGRRAGAELFDARLARTHGRPRLATMAVHCGFSPLGICFGFITASTNGRRWLRDQLRSRLNTGKGATNGAIPILTRPQG